VTFPKALEVQAAARMVPADRLLVETDAPYLAPRAHRGRTCEPAFVCETLQALAALRGDDPSALAAAAWDNGHRALGARCGALELKGRE
jgi:TatD DNase family protein